MGGRPRATSRDQPRPAGQPARRRGGPVRPGMFREGVLFRFDYFFSRERFYVFWLFFSTLVSFAHEILGNFGYSKMRKKFSGNGDTWTPTGGPGVRQQKVGIPEGTPPTPGLWG